MHTNNLAPDNTKPFVARVTVIDANTMSRRRFTHHYRPYFDDAARLRAARATDPPTSDRTLHRSGRNVSSI